MSRHARPRRRRGFTLVEVAIVLLIVATLLGGLLMPLAAQMENSRIAETQRTLALAQDALLGFAAANGRLPCPATAASAGQEAFAAGGGAGTGQCADFFGGFLPAVTLGLSGLDDQGFLRDGWWSTASNRIRYAVANETVGGVQFAVTRTGGMRTATIAQLAATNLLYVCSAAATGAPPAPCVAPAVTLTNRAPAVVYSVGANAGDPASGANPASDEGNNPNPNGGSVDQVFVSRDRTTTGGNSFDDMLVWLSLNTLINRMITAGQLP